MDLFFFGTLRHLPLLRVVLGRAPKVQPAQLEGARAQRVAGEDHPMLVPGGMAQGLLLRDASAQDLARLVAYEGGFGFDLERRVVQGPDGPVEAQVFRASQAQRPSGQPWDLAAWQDSYAEIAVEAAAEIMRGFARGESAADLAKRRAIIWARAASRQSNGRHTRPVTRGQELGAADVTLIDRQIAYEGFFRLEEVSVDHPRFDGTRSGPVSRAVFQVCDAATVLPYDPGRDRVLLIEQFRVAPWVNGDPRPWQLEPIAGMIDAGETEIACAIRESREEAGLPLAERDFHKIARYYASPGGITQVFTSFVALADLPDSAARLGGAAEEGEDIRGHLVAFADVMAMVDSGEICNAPLILSAQWLALHRARLRA